MGKGNSWPPRVEFRDIFRPYIVVFSILDVVYWNREALEVVMNWLRVC